MLQKVKDVFALSESVLPSPAVEAEVVQREEQSPPALTETTIDVSEQFVSDPIELEKQALLEKTHAVQQEDRAAWLSFRRQKPLLATKPVARAFELPSKTNVAVEAADLPEVHFASANPPPSPAQLDPPILETVPQLPTQLTLVADSSSDVIKKTDAKEEVPPARVATEQPTARVATLPIRDDYIAPFGNNSTTGTPAASLILPPKKSWETGQY